MTLPPAVFDGLAELLRKAFHDAHGVGSSDFDTLADMPEGPRERWRAVARAVSNLPFVAQLMAENEILREELTTVCNVLWGVGKWDGDLDTEYDIPQRVAMALKLSSPRPTPGLGGLSGPGRGPWP